jgi:hypothetical protein
VTLIISFSKSNKQPQDQQVPKALPLEVLQQAMVRMEKMSNILKSKFL